MSHNKQIIYKSLEKIVLEKPKLLRSDSPIKYIIDAVKNNNFIQSHTENNDNIIKKNVYQTFEMYSGK